MPKIRTAAASVRHRHRATPGTSLGLHARQADELIREVERGLPFRALDSLEAASGLERSAVAAVIGIPQRTLARRKSEGRLSPSESERLLRIALIFEKAVRMFEGDTQGAVRWLETPRRAFGFQTPIAYSRTEIGAREVEALIGRLEHGVFS